MNSIEVERTNEGLEFTVEGEFLILDVTCVGEVTTDDEHGEVFKPTRLISWEFNETVHPLTRKLFVECDSPIKFKLAQTISTAIKEQLHIV